MSVAHLDHPDAPLGSVAGGGETATPFGLGVRPPAAAVLGLRLQPLGGGPPVSIAGLRGSRATVVAFFASYCVACRTELPALQQMAARVRAQGVNVVLVDFKEDAGTAAAFLRERGVGLPAWLDESGSAHDGLGLIDVPSTAVLDPGGAVADRLEGFAGTAELADSLRAMGAIAQ